MVREKTKKNKETTKDRWKLRCCLYIPLHIHLSTYLHYTSPIPNSRNMKSKPSITEETSPNVYLPWALTKLQAFNKIRRHQMYFKILKSRHLEFLNFFLNPLSPSLT